MLIYFNKLHKNLYPPSPWPLSPLLHLYDVFPSSIRSVPHHYNLLEFTTALIVNSLNITYVSSFILLFQPPLPHKFCAVLFLRHLRYSFSSSQVSHVYKMQVSVLFCEFILLPFHIQVWILLYSLRFQHMHFPLKVTILPHISSSHCSFSHF